MSANLTAASVWEQVQSTVQDVIKDYKDEPDTDRETLIERMDEECDTLFGQLVYMGLVSEWDEDTLADHGGECAEIIKAAKRHAWVEDDSGLWDGLTYGVLGSIAFFSLRNLLYQAMSDAGHDSNDDLPFAKDESDE